MMTSVEYNYQNLSILLFRMLIRAIVIYVPLGFQNLNNKDKSKETVLVVLK